VLGIAETILKKIKNKDKTILPTFFSFLNKEKQNKGRHIKKAGMSKTIP